MTLTATDIAQKAEEYKTAFVGISVAMVTLLDPSLPLMDVMRRHGQEPDSPFLIKRLDGTEHSDEAISVHLQRAAALPGGGLRGDVLIFAAMHGATRIGDAIQQAQLSRKNDPLLQFDRHFRNAAAHGNRWYLRRARGTKHPALKPATRLPPRPPGAP
jgi:hypothetical protein